ncbi:PorP/SprF family type IX secretion system membrane protein [Membranihabitans maritimus]|uniref:PorP/SprF family type IX secretion system membrane protein n=1 Tax=Membranihabitans maritimus TaxID=2904244 RepID=UPI001F169E24|nr:PorP/SprF family type IX secretion system membrane protein [Membranihabitans maritimus]
MRKHLHFKILVVFVLFGYQVFTQDIHMSQFDHSFRIMNPALTGIFNGEHRLEGNYKRQWKQVPVDYMTFTGSYDSKFQPPTSDNSLFGYGLNLNYDRAGFSKLSLLQIALNGSYSHFLNPNNIITGGLQVGFGQRTLRQDDLSFDGQFINGQYDPANPTGENFDRMNASFFHLAAGLNYRYQTEKNSLNIGTGFFNINKPAQNFLESDNPPRLPLRTTVYGDLWLGLGDRFRWNLNAGSQWQSSYEELTFGTKFEFHVNQRRGDDLFLSLGSYARLSTMWDAVSPYVGIRYNSFDVGVTYDINVSQFNVATNQRGGPEVWVRYIIKDVDEIDDFKTCRIY